MTSYFAYQVAEAGETFLYGYCQTTNTEMFFCFVSYYSYEAAEARCCIGEGKIESDAIRLEESLILAEIMDEIMKQLDVK